MKTHDLVGVASSEKYDLSSGRFNENGLYIRGSTVPHRGRDPCQPARQRPHSAALWPP